MIHFLFTRMLCFFPWQQEHLCGRLSCHGQGTPEMGKHASWACSVLHICGLSQDSRVHSSLLLSEASQLMALFQNRSIYSVDSNLRTRNYVTLEQWPKCKATCQKVLPHFISFKLSVQTDTAVTSKQFFVSICSRGQSKTTGMYVPITSKVCLKS